MDCKLRRTSDWATRATHEAQLHENNAFITLTFSDDGLGLRELQHGTHPYDLDMGDWQRFAKRLRKELRKQGKGSFRFFQVGEYGDEQRRPHYHALIFGQDFRDGGEWWKDDAGHPTWTSRAIEKSWPYGFHEVKDLTPQSVEYVCKYVTKKLYGKELEKLRERIDCETGECVTVRPELASMSRGSKKAGTKGIGHGWWEKWKTDVFPDDYIVIEGKKKPVPKYYTKQLEKEDAARYEQLQEERKEKAATRAADNTPSRRQVRERVTNAKVSLSKKRKL